MPSRRRNGCCGCGRARRIDVVRAILKPILLFAAQLVGFCLALYLYFFFSFGWWRCTGNDAAADRIRAMDQQALARLYADTQAFLSKPRPTSLLDDIGGHALPPAFSGLGVKYARVYGDEMVFMLSGCHDDKVFLNVRRDAEDGSGEIVLSPGDARASEVLWSGGADNLPSQ